MPLTEDMDDELKVGSRVELLPILNGAPQYGRIERVLEDDQVEVRWEPDDSLEVMDSDDVGLVKD